MARVTRWATRGDDRVCSNCQQLDGLSGEDRDGPGDSCLNPDRCRCVLYDSDMTCNVEKRGVER